MSVTRSNRLVVEGKSDKQAIDFGRVGKKKKKTWCVCVCVETDLGRVTSDLKAHAAKI